MKRKQPLCARTLRYAARLARRESKAWAKLEAKWRVRWTQAVSVPETVIARGNTQRALGAAEELRMLANLLDREAYAVERDA